MLVLVPSRVLVVDTVFLVVLQQLRVNPWEHVFYNFVASEQLKDNTVYTYCIFFISNRTLLNKVEVIMVPSEQGERQFRLNLTNKIYQNQNLRK